MTFVFNKHGDYKSEFIAYIDILFKVADTLTPEERVQNADDLIEAYVTAIGQTPSGAQLDRLGSYILRHDLTENDPHKVSKTEYPVLSEHQVERRDKRQVDGRITNKYGTDGKLHGRGTRNRKTNVLE